MIGPYIDTELHTEVSITPPELNKELYYNILKKLKKTVEGKCNQFGCVIKIYKITDYKDPYIPPEDFEAHPIFQVKYLAKLCIPKIDNVFPAEIKKINKILIFAQNGAMNIYIKIKGLYNTDNFKTDLNGDLQILRQKDSVLSVGDQILIRVINLEYFINDKNIRIYAFLEDLYDEDSQSSLKKIKMDTKKLETTEYEDENEEVEQPSLSKKDLTKEYIRMNKKDRKKKK